MPPNNIKYQLTSLQIGSQISNDATEIKLLVQFTPIKLQLAFKIIILNPGCTWKFQLIHGMMSKISNAPALNCFFIHDAISLVNVFMHGAISIFVQMNYERLSHRLGSSVSFETVLYLLLPTGTEKKVFTKCSSKIVAVNATFNLSTNIDGVNITGAETEITVLSSNPVRFSVIQLVLLLLGKA